MPDNTYTYLLADARQALVAHRLLSALQSLHGVAIMLKAGDKADELDTLLSSYRILLNYMERGMDDPERAKMYVEFTRQAWEIGDALERCGLLSDSSSFYTTSRQTLLKLKGGNADLPALLAGGCDHRNLFDAVWTSGQWTAREETAVSDFLSSDTGDGTGRLLVVSAMTLGAMSFFDVAKYRVLLDAVLSTDDALRIRALAGLVFVHIAHSDRLQLYPDVEARLKLMADVKGFRTELELLQMQLFLSLETKRIERNLREEIIPQVMKRLKDLRIDRSLGLDEMKEKLDKADLNPEWEADGKPSKLIAHMNEFVELQKRGADMYISTFKMLKARFPFFSVAANWFCPFSLNHPEIPDNARHSDTLQVLLQGAGLCDADKYSFAFMVATLPQFPTGMGGTKASDLLKQLRAGGGQEAKQEDKPSVRELLRSYIQGFYRFSHLYAHRDSFVNPFKLNPFLADYPPFDSLLDDGDFVARMADFAFTDKTYALAQKLFERIPRKDLTASQCQKLGYCYEETKNTRKAIDSYTLANALKPSSEWTLRRLASCERAEENYEEALKAYDELAAILPEDAAIALRQAECCIHLERYEEAFKHLFKADYLAPDGGQAVRALAWCSLLTGKYDQAEHHYMKVLSSSPTPSDWLNAGHTAWLQGRVGEAVSRYRKALPKEEPEKFLQADAALLRRAGLSNEDLALMTDAVLNGTL